MRDAQLALIRKFEELQTHKEHRQYFKAHLELYQSLNLLYNVEWDWVYILFSILFAIQHLPDLVIKNGRMKPPMIDDLYRSIWFELSMKGVTWTE